MNKTKKENQKQELKGLIDRMKVSHKIIGDLIESSEYAHEKIDKLDDKEIDNLINHIKNSLKRA